MNYPNLISSLALAIIAFSIDYLALNGAGIPWVPMALLFLPVIAKAIQVQFPPSPAEPAAMARGDTSASSATAETKWQRFLVG